MAGKVKFKRGWATEIMKSPGATAEVGKHVNATMASLDPADYGHAVEDGGDRTRGAVWTQSAKAKQATARFGELLKALK